MQFRGAVSGAPLSHASSSYAHRCRRFGTAPTPWLRHPQPLPTGSFVAPDSALSNDWLKVPHSLAAFGRPRRRFVHAVIFSDVIVPPLENTPTPLEPASCRTFRLGAAEQSKAPRRCRVYVSLPKLWSVGPTTNVGLRTSVAAFPGVHSRIE